MNNKKYFLYVDGRKVPVSEEVYTIYAKSERKERYMLSELKQGRLIIDGEKVIEVSSREDSYDRLLEADRQFPDSSQLSLDDALCKHEMLKKLEMALCSLTDDELALIQEVFYLERTEREIAKNRNMAPTTIHSRKVAVLKKLRKLLEKNI